MVNINKTLTLPYKKIGDQISKIAHCIFQFYKPPSLGRKSKTFNAPFSRGGVKLWWIGNLLTLKIIHQLNYGKIIKTQIEQVINKDHKLMRIFKWISSLLTLTIIHQLNYEKIIQVQIDVYIHISFVSYI